MEKILKNPKGSESVMTASGLFAANQDDSKPWILLAHFSQRIGNVQTEKKW